MSRVVQPERGSPNAQDWRGGCRVRARLLSLALSAAGGAPPHIPNCSPPLSLFPSNPRALTRDRAGHSEEHHRDLSHAHRRRLRPGIGAPLGQLAERKGD